MSSSAGCCSRTSVAAAPLLRSGPPPIPIVEREPSEPSATLLLASPSDAMRMKTFWSDKLRALAEQLGAG